MIQHPEASDVVNLARLYAYRAGKFWLVDVPVKEARWKRLQLLSEGWIVTHTDIV